MTTSDTGKRPLRLLLESCNWVFDHPILRAIAEKAPTPKAADDHVVKALGLPNQAGKALRDAVHIRELYPTTWKELLGTEIRPVAAVCDFTTGTMGLLGVQLQTARRFDEVRLDTTSYPLFLRELRLPQQSWTSFDGKGSYRPNDFKTADSKWVNFPSTWIKPIYVFLRDDHWAISTDGENALPFDLRVGIYPAVSYTVTGIPVFWKAIELEKAAGPARPYATERIRLIVRTDTARITQYTTGHMEYAHIAPYSRGPNDDHQTLTVTADFTVSQEENGGWQAHAITNTRYPASLTPAIHLGCERMGISIGQGNVDDVLPHVTPVLSRLADAKKVIDLRTIFGQSLMDTPPENLIDLIS